MNGASEVSRGNGTNGRAGRVTIKVRAFLISLLIVVVIFYGLNHLVMALQGLPLNLDLTPAG